jgi:hypothetical protein
LAAFSPFNFWLNNGKSGKPLTRFPFDSHSLDNGIDGDFPMKVDFHQPYFGQVKSFVIEKSTIAILGIGKRVISSESFEARIARFVALLNSSKESLERKVNPLLGVLKKLGKYLSEFGFLGFPRRKQLVGSILGDRLLLFFPSILSSGKSLVVGPPTKFKSLPQQGFLGCRWTKPELVGGLTHNGSIAQSHARCKWFPKVSCSDSSPRLKAGAFSSQNR